MNCIVEGQVSTALLLFPESYSIQEQIRMHEHNYQQLYHTFFDSCSSPEQKLMLHHFVE